MGIPSILLNDEPDTVSLLNALHGLILLYRSSVQRIESINARYITIKLHHFNLLAINSSTRLSSRNCLKFIKAHTVHYFYREISY